MPVTVSQKSTVIVRFEGRVDLTACTGAGCEGGAGRPTFMTATVFAGLAGASGGAFGSTSTNYGSAIGGGMSEQGGRKFQTSTTVTMPVSVSHVQAGVAPGSYRALAEILTPTQSVAHRFSPTQIIVEIFPER
jgi:hypothetical protein